MTCSTTFRSRGRRGPGDTTYCTRGHPTLPRLTATIHCLAHLVVGPSHASRSFRSRWSAPPDRDSGSEATRADARAPASGRSPCHHRDNFHCRPSLRRGVRGRASRAGVDDSTTPALRDRAQARGPTEHRRHPDDRSRATERPPSPRERPSSLDVALPAASAFDSIEGVGIAGRGRNRTERPFGGVQRRFGTAAVVVHRWSALVVAFVFC